MSESPWIVWADWKPYCPLSVRQSSRSTASLAAKMPPPGTLSVTVLFSSFHPRFPVWLMAVWSTKGVNFWMVRYWMTTSSCSPMVMLLSIAVGRVYWPSRVLPTPSA